MNESTPSLRRPRSLRIALATGAVALLGTALTGCTIVDEVCSDTNPTTGVPWTTSDPVPEGYSSIRVKATVNGQQDPIGARGSVTSPDSGAADPPSGTDPSNPAAG